MVYFSDYGIKNIQFRRRNSDFVLIFHIFSLFSRAFATMAKPYTSQSYINDKRDCNTFIPWSNMQIILFLYS